MNKLISLSSEGKFSIIDSVVEKVSKKTEERKKSESYEILSSAKKGSSTQQFDVIEEEDEEALIEEEGLQEIKKAEEAEGIKEEVVEKYEKQLVSLAIKGLDMKLGQSQIFDSICHTWFIVKDKGMEINWRKPLLQKS
jgi:hypothetical protein